MMFFRSEEIYNDYLETAFYWMVLLSYNQSDTIMDFNSQALRLAAQLQFGVVCRFKVILLSETCLTIKHNYILYYCGA